MVSYVKYILTFCLIFLSGILATVFIIFVMDPFFHYHMPWFGLMPVVNDEIYQNPGLAAHASYDSIIIGSSMSENFDAAWFDEAYGIQTLKLTYSGAHAENLRIAVECAQSAQKEDIQYVFGNLDMSIFTEKANETNGPLPEYLYDDVLYNDVYYLLNKDVFLRILENWRDNYIGNVRPMNQAYIWAEGQKAEFSKENVLKRLTLADEFIERTQKEPIITDNTVMVVDIIKDFITSYPDTKYKLFYSPYSIAFWYNAYESGELSTHIAVLEYSMKEILECENVELYFPITYERITSFDHYKDLAHYDMDIQYQIFEEMRDGVHQLTKENYQQYIKNFENMILETDFESLFRE